MNFSDYTYYAFLKPKTGVFTQGIYLFLLVIMLTSVMLLPYIKTDITIKAQGITRPRNERTDVKTVLAGIIDTLFYGEGQKIEKNQVILRIKDFTTGDKQIHNRFEIDQRTQFIHDLKLLTNDIADENLSSRLKTPLYLEQLHHFFQQKEEQDILLKKANKELELNTSLAKDKVISPKEFFDIQNNQEKLLASTKSFVKGQLSNWQLELARYELELSQFNQQMKEVNSNAGYYEIRAPIAGIIQGITARYSGGSVQANETLCSISPEGTIVGECFMQTKDVGLLKIGQPVRYQVEAYDYNYFGVLTGKILSIDNDFTSVDSRPLFKVYCSFDSTQLHLKNGFTGQLKKGLGFQASFTIAQRSVWQLLFDKLDDWLNPNAPALTLTAIH